MKRLPALLGLLLLLVCLSATQAWASQVKMYQAGGTQFPHRALLLSVGSAGVLTPRQISITENGMPVSDLTVTPASKVAQSHFGTVLVIDTSDSMKGLAEDSAIAAARAFVKSRNPAQPVGIILFDQTARVIAPMTTDDATLNRALATIPTLHSGTHMFDAVGTANNMLSAAHLTAGSIVLVSDGRDTGSSESLQSVANQSKSQGVRIYTIGVQDSSFDGTSLQGLAAASGGVYTPANSSALVSVYHDLGVALSNQYLVRYISHASLGSKVAVIVHVAGHGTAVGTYSTAPVAPAAPSGPAGKAHSTPFFKSTAAVVLVCIICALLFGLAIMALITRRTGVRQRVGPFVGLNVQQPIEDKPRSLVQRALGDPHARRVEKSGWAAVLAEEIDVANLPISLPRLLALTALATVVLAYVLVQLEGALGALLALVFPVAVRIWVRFKANRQRRAFGEQLPDNLAVVASALRAGNTFVGSLGVVTNDAPEPSRRELRRALADEQLGVPLVDALNRISDRMDSTDFHHVALVATLQAETGGNTAEVLDVVTETIRERLELRRLVRTLTAQGRLAGWVISALPVALLLFLSFINPHYVSPLFHTTIGIIALTAAGVMIVTGSLVIRKIVDIDV
jgi:tight adherence protein B